MNSKSLVEQCAAAAARFFELPIWDLPGVEQPFVVRIEGHSQPWAAAILNGEVPRRGLTLLSGGASLSELMNPVAVAASVMDGMEGRKTLLVMEGGGEQDAPRRPRPLREVEREAAAEPMLLAVESGPVPRAQDEAELRITWQVLEGLRRSIDERLLLDPWRLGEDEYPLLELSGRPEWTQAKVGRVLVPDEAEAPLVGSIEEAGRLPRLDAAYELGVVDDPDQSPGELLVVTDRQSGECLACAELGDRAAEHVEYVLLKLLSGQRLAERGRPRALRFRERELFERLGPRLEAIGIDCELADRLPDFEAIAQQVADEFRDAIDGFEETLADPGVASGPEFLEWRERDIEVSTMLAMNCEATALGSKKAAKRYFGRARAMDGPPRDEFEASQQEAYLEWYSLSYRARKDSATVAERLLAKAMDPELRELLQARAGACPSVYQVIGVEPGRSVKLHDLLRQETVTVHEPGMSSIVDEGSALVLRVYAAGPFRFASPAGPGLDDGLVDLMLEFLGQQVDLSRPLDEHQEHLLGRLWDWAEGPRCRHDDIPH